MLTLRKKSYLIDFSFKFNEIKFCTLLMNWLIWEKMLTYFYNKFRPVNCMYFIKCCVNSSLHNSGCCIRSVAPWITVLSWHSIQKEGDISQIYFCAIFRETRHHAQTHIIAGALSALSLAARRTQTAEQMSWLFRWPVFAVATSAEACCHCCCCSSHSSF